MEAIKTTEVQIQRATEKSEGGSRTLGKSKRRVRDIRQEQVLGMPYCSLSDF